MPHFTPRLHPFHFVPIGARKGYRLAPTPQRRNRGFRKISLQYNALRFGAMFAEG
jgi:hypothetical protein